MRLTFTNNNFTYAHTFTANSIEESYSLITTNPSISNVLQASVICVGVRIWAVFTAVVWVFAIVPLEVLPMLFINSAKKMSSYQGTVFGFVQYTVKIHYLFLRMFFIETAFFIGDILFPEILYGFFHLNQKRLDLHLDSVIQNIPPFPSVFRKAANHNSHNKDVVEFAHSIGIQDSEWQSALYSALEKFLHRGLTNDRYSVKLKEKYMEVICDLTIQKLLTKIKTDDFRNCVQSLSLDAMKILYKKLPLELISKIFEARPEFESELEQMRWKTSGYKYRSTITRKFLEIVFDYMKISKRELLRKEIDVDQGAHFCIALLKMLDDAQILQDGSLKISSPDEPIHIVLAHAKQIYGSKDFLIELSLCIQNLSPEQKEELLMKFCFDNNSMLSENVELAYQMISEYKTNTFDKEFTQVNGYNKAELINLQELGNLKLEM